MKFSVIVPVYNAENYLHKLVESVLQQTYKDYELILVDDGSTDGSYALMKQYAKRYDQIKAYTKENTGPGMTRKFGFEKPQEIYFSLLIVMIGLLTRQCWKKSIILS